MQTLVAIPVHNEARYIARVLPKVREFADRVLVIDDGSTDATPERLATLREPLGLDVVTHTPNRGYGGAILAAFEFAARAKYDWVITMDCDEQHEPQALPHFVRRAARGDLDIVSGSRYLSDDPDADRPPPERRAINATITREINDRLASLLGPALEQGLTDAFCGFKAHRVSAMQRLNLDETGYAFPMQLWVQAAANRLRVGEIPVKLIYNDPNRTFGGDLDVAETRLNHYRCALYRELERCADRLPASAFEDRRARCPEGPSEVPG